MGKTILALLLFLFCMFFVEIQGIGFCREDKVCVDKPLKPGDTCKCWSTCSPVGDARQCDGANPEYNGYERDKVGQNDVSCNFLPFVKNARDLCIWYYDPDQAILKFEVEENLKLRGSSV